jgi:hypothetical protein
MCRELAWRHVDSTLDGVALFLFGEIARGGMGAVLRGRDVDLGASWP